MEFVKARSSFLSLLLVIFAAWTEAREINLPWTVSSNFSYGQWAHKQRILINDTLVFQNATDSVLLVNKDAYTKCDTTNPIANLQDYKETFKNPGFYYFISGNNTSCKNNQKLVLLVITPRAPKSSSNSTGSPAPTPQKAAVSPVGTPAGGSIAPTMTPPFKSPSAAPAISPLMGPVNSIAPANIPSAGSTKSPLMAPANTPLTGPTRSPLMAPRNSAMGAPADMSPSGAPVGSRSGAAGPNSSGAAGGGFRCGSVLIGLIVFVAMKDF